MVALTICMQADFRSEMDKLAVALMQNPDAESPTNPKTPKAHRSSACSSDDADTATHVLAPIRYMITPSSSHAHSSTQQRALYALRERAR